MVYYILKDSEKYAMCDCHLSWYFTDKFYCKSISYILLFTLYATYNKKMSQVKQSACWEKK